MASFLTPIGHHGNLLILNPGQYRFGDFLRVGVPLTVLLGLTSAWLAQWLWLGGPLVPDFSRLPDPRLLLETMNGSPAYP